MSVKRLSLYGGYGYAILEKRHGILQITLAKR